MQDAFAELWSRPNGYQSGRGSLRTYLFGIARKRSAEWWRRQHRGGTPVEHDAANDRIETRSAIHEAFQRLPEGQRTLLWLREVEGQSYEELADIFEIPVGTVRSRLSAARKAWRQVWRGAAQPRRESL